MQREVLEIKQEQQQI
jgi:hypothetical protein